MALGHLSVTQRITSLTATDLVSTTCNLFYGTTRDEVLEAHRWQMAKKVAALAQIAGVDPPPGWGYMYAYPADCLAPRIIYTADGLRQQSAWVDPETARLIPPKYAFELQQHPSSSETVLVCDVEDAYLEYTTRVTVTARFSAQFTTALSYLLASRLGPALRADVRLAQNALQMYTFLIGAAQAHNMNAQTPDPTPESPSIAIRG